jgi:hypothetical protein
MMTILMQQSLCKLCFALSPQDEQSMHHNKNNNIRKDHDLDCKRLLVLHYSFIAQYTMVEPGKKKLLHEVISIDGECDDCMDDVLDRVSVE